MATQLLMPQATAVWLIDNTTLTFGQIAELCGLHELEIQGIADGEVAVNILGQSPVQSGQVDAEEIARCEANPSASIQLRKRDDPLPAKRGKARYTPISKRRDKPDAIAFLLKTYAQLSDAQIVKLIGTTKKTIERIRENTHRNSNLIELKDPVLVGLCTARDLNAALEKADARAKAREKTVTEKPTAPGASSASPAER